MFPSICIGLACAVLVETLCFMVTRTRKYILLHFSPHCGPEVVVYLRWAQRKLIIFFLNRWALPNSAAGLLLLSKVHLKSCHSLSGVEDLTVCFFTLGFCAFWSEWTNCFHPVRLSRTLVTSPDVCSKKTPAARSNAMLNKLQLGAPQDGSQACKRRRCRATGMETSADSGPHGLRSARPPSLMIYPARMIPETGDGWIRSSPLAALNTII